MASDVLYFVPFLRVSAQDAFKKISSVFGDELGYLEVSPKNLLVEVSCVRILKGEVPTDEGEHYHSTAPNIDIRAMVLLPSNHFRCGIAGTTTGCLECLSCLVGVAQAEVHNLDVLVLV